MKYPILHIEDSEIDHELFLRGSKQMPVHWVKTSKEAEEYLNILPIDELPQIIIVDLNLPVENGINLIMRLKANPKFKIIPLIVLSSIAERKEIEACYLMGANAFIQKTLKPNELLLKIDTMLKFWFETIVLPHHKGNP